MHNDVIEIFRRELRNVEWPGETLEQLPNVTRRCSADGQMNLVTAHELTTKTAGAAILAEIDHFKSLGRTFEWKYFSFDEPFDLIGRLSTAGLKVGGHEAVVVYDLQNGIDALIGEFRCHVERIDRIEQLADFRLVAEDVFGKNYSFTTNQLAEALRAGRKDHEGYIGYIDGVPATVGRLYTNPGSAFAGLYGGGTRSQFRSQGCYRAVVAARAKDAIDRGARYLQVDALPTSLPILTRLGFVKIADTWPLQA